MKAPALMITCEHASNAVPDFILRALRDSKIPDDVLASHRAYDITRGRYEPQCDQQDVLFGVHSRITKLCKIAHAEPLGKVPRED